MITQTELKELLHYDPETGDFTWLKNRGSRARIGGRAGSTESTGYIQICIKKKLYMAHRLAWFYIHGEWPPAFIDHIDGNRSSNILKNLRSVTRCENQQNQKLYRTNKSGISGVFWVQRLRKWRVNIQKDKKYDYLGAYDNIFDAACAKFSAQHRLGFHKNHGRR